MEMKTDLPGEFTRGGRRYIYERHASAAHFIDLMLLRDDSETLSAAGALVLAFPGFARKARFRHSVAKSAAVLYDILVQDGWTTREILQAGIHATGWLVDQAPPLRGSEDAQEAEDFSEDPADSTPAGS